MLQERFLEGMRRAASAVSIVTKGPGGRARMTVGAICPAAAGRVAPFARVPPLRPARAAKKGNGNSRVNVRRDGHSAIADAFAGHIPSWGGDESACAKRRRFATGAPAVDAARVPFDRARMKHAEWGSHCAFSVVVVDIGLAAAAGRALTSARHVYGSARLATDEARRALAA